GGERLLPDDDVDSPGFARVRSAAGRCDPVLRRRQNRRVALAAAALLRARPPGWIAGRRAGGNSRRDPRRVWQWEALGAGLLPARLAGPRRARPDLGDRAHRYPDCRFGLWALHAVGAPLERVHDGGDDRLR